MEFRLQAERLGKKEFRLKAELHAKTPCAGVDYLMQ